MTARERFSAMATRAGAWSRRELRQDSLRPRADPPEIEDGRCVHSRIVAAACRACADACPAQAWSLDEDELALDLARCDGCGLCLAACPASALAQPYEARVFPDSASAFAACQRAAPLGDPGVVPCVHGLGEQVLFGCAVRGVETLHLARGDCDVCARGTSRRLEKVLLDVNAVLESRGLGSLRLIDSPSARWRREFAAAAAPPDVRVARRRFLGLAAGTPTRGRESAGENAARRAASQALPPSDRGLFPWVPAMAEQRCEGCDACARICPTGAIREGEAAYALDPGPCTGCGLCRDVCSAGAITVKRLARADATRIPYQVRRCVQCGAEYKVLGPVRDAASRTCRVCLRTGRGQPLFRRLDPA